MPKLDFDKPDQLQTRDGRLVRIYATDGVGLHCIHGAILDKNGWEVAKWMADGVSHNSVTESQYDLVRKPVRVTGWLNVYENFNFLAPKFGDVAYETQQLAKENISSKGECFGQIYIDSEVQE